MNLCKHKRAYLSTLLVVISIAILWMLITLTASKTIPTNESLKSGIEGSAMVVGDCPGKKSCAAKRIKADIAVTDANGKSMRITSGSDGRFTMKLVPGTYTASATNTIGDQSLTAPSLQVTVVKNQYTRITFNFE